MVTISLFRTSQGRPAIAVVFIFVLVGLFSVCGSAAAVTILERETKQQFRGYLIQENERRVVIDELLPDGSTRRLTFDRAKVEVFKRVDDSQLAELDSDKPADYRMYADELSEAKADPDARRTAIRLYLIAAYLNPEELGRGSLVAMADLASTPEEARRFSAMAYLMDPARDRSLLKTREVPVSKRPPLAADKKLLEQGLRAFWSGHKLAAARMADREDFKKSLAAYSGVLTWEEYREAAKSRGEALPSATMRKVAALALTLAGRTAVAKPRPSEASEPPTWSQLDWQRTAALTKLSLETITPFDPRECHFRHGKWVAEE